MSNTTCRFCGIEIEVLEVDLPEGTVRLGDEYVHQACVYPGNTGSDAGRTGGVLEQEFQQARARGPVSAG